MTEQLESELRAALRERAAQVPAASIARLSHVDYYPRTRRLRPPLAIGALASAAGAAGARGDRDLAQRGRVERVRGVESEADPAGARSARRRQRRLSDAVADRRPSAEAGRHARAVHVLGVRRQQLERDLHQGPDVHRRSDQHDEQPDRPSRPVTSCCRARTRATAAERVLVGGRADRRRRERGDADPRRRHQRAGDGRERLVRRVVAWRRRTPSPPPSRRRPELRRRRSTSRTAVRCRFAAVPGRRPERVRRTAPVRAAAATAGGSRPAAAVCVLRPRQRDRRRPGGHADQQRLAMTRIWFACVLCAEQA